MDDTDPMDEVMDDPDSSGEDVNVAEDEDMERHSEDDAMDQAMELEDEHQGANDGPDDVRAPFDISATVQFKGAQE